MNSVDNCSVEIINISDDVIVISDDVIVISSDSDSSVINISDTSEYASIAISAECPSFDFESSAKKLLPQPRTSTPMVERSFFDSAMKAEKREFKLILEDVNFFVFFFSKKINCVLCVFYFFLSPSQFKII